MENGTLASVFCKILGSKKNTRVTCGTRGIFDDGAPLIYSIWFANIGIRPSILLVEPLLEWFLIKSRINIVEDNQQNNNEQQQQQQIKKNKTK